MQICVSVEQNIKKRKEVVDIFQLIFLILIVWALQCVFTFLQIKYFNKNYLHMRKRGFVLVGKQKTRISKGCVILLQITRDGEILDNKVLNGYSVFTRFKTLPNITDKNILNNWEEEKFNSTIKKALLNAKENYLKELEKLNEEKIVLSESLG